MSKLAPVPTGASASFGGFGDAAFDFLRMLAERQDRAWFNANKAVYEEAVLAPMQALVADVAARLARRRIPLRASVRQPVFRIYRDVRFSKDKRPYKTHVGAALSRDGSKNGPGVLYIHVEPGAAFVACGFYYPEPEALAALRDSIASDAAGFAALTASLARGRLHLAPDENALKRCPAGYDHVTDAERAAALRCRSFVVSRPLGAEALASPALAGLIADFAKAALPLLVFGWAALD